MLLADEPRNGYQLMQAIEERTGGRWRPSPGSVYPTLAQLEDEGLIQATERDANKLFELTDAGRAHIAAHHADTPSWCGSDDPADARVRRDPVADRPDGPGRDAGRAGRQRGAGPAGQ